MAVDLQLSNNARSTLAASISSTSTSLDVVSGHGSRFPALTGDQYFYATILDGDGNYEVIKVEARSVDTLSSLSRGQDGTAARAWDAGAIIRLSLTEAALTEFVEQNDDLVKAGIQAQSYIYGDDGGAADAYTLDVTPSITAYAAGQGFAFKAANPNTGASTLNVDGLGAQTIKKRGGGTDLEAGDIITGQVVWVVYDGTNFQIVAAEPILASDRAWVLLGTANPSGAAAVDFTDMDGTYDLYILEMIGFQPATDSVVLTMSVSFDNGGSFETTDHQSVVIRSAGGALDSATGAASSWSINANPNQGNQDGELLDVTVELYGFGQSRQPAARSNGRLLDPSASDYLIAGAFAWTGASTGANAIRIAYSSGNIAAGKAILYGVRN